MHSSSKQPNRADLAIYSLMVTYDDKTLNCIPPTLQPGEKEHVLVMQDETIFHTNKYCCRIWLTCDQQPI